MRVRLEVGDIIADPELRSFVPPDLFAFRVPRPPVSIARGAIVENAAIGRPRPCPVGINALTRGILCSPPRKLRPSFSPASGVDPVAARGGPVVFQPCEARHLLAAFNDLLSLRIGEIG